MVRTRTRRDVFKEFLKSKLPATVSDEKLDEAIAGAEAIGLVRGLSRRIDPFDEETWLAELTYAWPYVSRVLKRQPLNRDAYREARRCLDPSDILGTASRRRRARRREGARAG